MTFYTLNFFIINKTEGHFYEYLVSLNQALEINDIQTVNWVPIDCEIDDKRFIKILHRHSLSYKKNIWYQILLPFKNLKTLNGLFKKIKIKAEKQSLIFADGFVLGHLLSLIVSLLLVRPKIKLCLLHRYDPNQRFSKGKIHYFLHKLFEIIIGKNNLFLFTDTEPLAASCIKCFKKNVIVLPIPHAVKNLIDRPLGKGDNRNEILCWWPGIIREEKGLENIRKIINELFNKSKRFKIIMSEIGKDYFPPIYTNIQYVKNAIERDSYYEIMKKSDLILLPYLKEQYFSRSSGVFVEAIAYGKVVLVSEGTWMACELNKFDLNELIVDWEKEDISKKFEAIINNNEIYNKINKMKSFYEDFHSVKNFAKILKQII